MNTFKEDIMNYEDLSKGHQSVLRLMAMDMVLCRPENRKTREKLLDDVVYISTLELSWQVVMDAVSVLAFEEHHEDDEGRILYSLNEQDNSAGRRLYVDKFELGRFGAYVTLDAFNGKEFLHPHYILTSRYHSGWDEINEHYKNNNLLDAYEQVIGMACVIWCRHIYFKDPERMFPNSKEVVEYRRKREQIEKNLKKYYD